MSRLLDFVYDVQLSFSVPVRRHAFVLRCLPDDGPGQRVLDLSLAVDPVTPLTLQRDGFGNRLQIGRLEDPHDHFRYTVRGTVRRDDACRAAQPCHPVFRLPSPYTQPDEAMKKFLAGLTLPEKPRARAWALAEAVHDRMHYVPGATGVATTAAQAFARGDGVCQDFAHIYLSLARMAGLSVRYVNGLPEGEGASHAWCEVWLGGIWQGIDPTRRQWADEGYLRFGVGRDFGDCPFERGVFVGGADQCQLACMKVTPKK